MRIYFDIWTWNTSGLHGAFVMVQLGRRGRDLFFGLAFVVENLPPTYAKMLFVSLLIAFAVALWILNSMSPDRTIHDSVIKSNESLNINQAGKDKGGDSTALLFQKRKSQLILFLVGSVGGIFSLVAGSGLDMATFSVPTLYFLE
jgi:hypothetical protein